MGISEDHLELVSNSNTSDHISDNASNSTKYSISLLLLKPHSESESRLAIFLGIFFSDFKWDVTEAFGEFSKWALDSDGSSFDLDSDSVWDFEFLF